MAWLLGLIVGLAGCLVSAGHFHTADEVSMFVTAVNVVDHGTFHTNQLGWGQWALRPGEEQGTLAASGDIYSKKSPLLILLMVPLVGLARLVPALGLVPAVLLLGPLFTGLTAGWLYGLARALGYARRVSVAAVLTFAFGTMALVYARLAMREVVASWGLLLALAALPAAARSPDSFRPSLLGGLGLMAAAGANAAYASLLPVFAVALWLARRGRVSVRRQLWWIVLLGAPLLVLGAALGVYNFVRFGSWLDTGYSFVPGQEGFSSPLVWGVLGLLLSPARGLVWYNPPVWLSLLAWPRFHRAHRLVSFTMLVAVVAQVVIFGKWWEWWGGYAWGPRFLLPTLPYFMVAALPLFEWLVQARGMRVTLGRLGAAAVLAAGLAVQVAGAAVDYNTYEIELDARFPAPAGQPLLYLHQPSLVYDVVRSPIVVHFQRLLQMKWDFAWWPGRETAKAVPDIVAAVRAQQRPGDVVIYLAPELLAPLLEARGLPPLYGLPVNVASTDSLAQVLFERAVRDAQRVWLITWYGPADPANWVEARLRHDWASVSEDSLDNYRVLLMARPPAAALQPAAADFGPIRLTAESVQFESDTLFVELQWEARATPVQNYVTFIHLLNPDGSLLMAQDRQPLGGYQPTGAWLPGQAVTDRFAFSLAREQMNGLWVEAGWYAWPSLDRLPVSDAGGRRLEGDRLLLPGFSGSP
jgi:hypothetical protein